MKMKMSQARESRCEQSEAHAAQVIKNVRYFVYAKHTSLGEREEIITVQRF